ncbi:MAG: response regulator [Myxococcales bacterium]|nr:response regulator [Myxococcales bacterium]
MAKQHLLLVDGDAKSLRVMEVSLKKAGFQVTTAIHGKDALEKVQISLPDLVLAETRMPEMDGFELCKVLKSDERFRHIPYVFLTSQKAVESKVKGLETGAEDYLTKPIYIKEVVTRVRMILAKVEKERFEKKEQRAGFAGNLSDMGVVDLVQTFEIGRKTGTIQILGERQGTVFFKEGRVVDAELGRLRGENAFYRMLNTFEGQFEVSFATLERAERIEVSTQGLLMEGMRRLDEWGRMLEQLPPLETVFELDYQSLADRLAEIPDEVNGLLRLFDGRRTLQRVVEDSDFEDLAALGIISKLYFEGLIKEVGTPSSGGDRARKPGIEEWLNTGPNPIGAEPAPKQPSVTPVQPMPPAASPPGYATAVAEELAMAEPDLPPLGEEESVELPLELDPLPQAPSIPTTASSPTPPPIAPVSSSPSQPPVAPPKAQVPVVHFEPRPRVPGQPSPLAATPEPVAAPEPSQFLVDKPPSELERARASLVEAWSTVDTEGLESSSTWAPMSGWSRPSPIPSAAPSAAGLEDAARPPTFGGAAKERYTLPAVEKPSPARTITADAIPVEPMPEPETPPAAAKVPPAVKAPPSPKPPGAAVPLPGAPSPLPSPPVTPPSVPPASIKAAPPPLPAPPPGPVKDSPQAPIVVAGFGDAPDTEEAFFEDTVGSTSQLLSGENPMPPKSRALPIVIALGFVVGIIGTVLVMNDQSGADVPVVDAGVELVVAPVVNPELAEVDAGLEEPDADAGELVDVAPVVAVPELTDAGRVADAGAPVVDAGPVAVAVVDAGAAVPSDAGPTVVDAGVASVRDAGLLLVDAGLVRDAGVAVVDAGRPAVDAGVKASVDAGAPVLVASKDAGVAAPQGGTLSDAEFDKLIEDGKAAIVAVKWGTAVKLYRQAVKDRPTDATARTGLGISLVFSETGFREAIPHLKEATKADPSNARAWLALGIALQNLSRDAEAKGPYRKYLELNPKGSDADEVRAALQAIP